MEKRKRQTPAPGVPQEGICLCSASADALVADLAHLRAWLNTLGLDQHVIAEHGERGGLPCVHLHLKASAAAAWAPGHDTLGLHRLLPQGLQDDEELIREIAVALLDAPQPFVFPDAQEVLSLVRMRSDIVLAARKTALAFDTDAAERPEDCWRYDEDTGFTLVPGHPLVDALVKATQPDATGRLYSFSCYRATEYVMLLAIARELERSNPPLHAALTRRWERKAIRSGAFHDVFLVEYGSAEAPLPPRYYVPGDRVWFRNPDPRSADIAGFEGSWVFYLGQGLFSNFWQRGRPFTLQTKCVEIFHWRDGVVDDERGEPRMDEHIVARQAERTLADPEALAGVLAKMMRLRDARGVDGGGGCIDTSREYPRTVHPGTCEIVLPPLG